MRGFELLHMICIALPAWTACASPQQAGETKDAAVAPAVAAPEATAPADERRLLDFETVIRWHDLGDAAFAAELADWTKDGASFRVDDMGLQLCLRAIEKSETGGVRAAVILAHTRDPRVQESLLSRLERRVPENVGTWTGDVVAAAGLAAFDTRHETAARIDALAIGPRPHPVWYVRIECALTSVALGRDTCVTFLLDLLRDGTGAAVKNADRPRMDWTNERDLRLQDRIAHTLSTRAGIECTYRSRGPLAAREQEIIRLAQSLQSASAPK